MPAHRIWISNPLALFGANQQRERVVLSGRWRVIDGQIEGLDLQALIAEHSQAARQLVGS